MSGIAATGTRRRQPAAADAAVAMPLAAALTLIRLPGAPSKRAPCPARVEQRVARR